MSSFDLLLQRYPQLRSCRDAIEQAHTILVKTFKNGGKLLVAGNGGSASDSGHMSTELLKSFCKKRPIPHDLAEKLGNEITAHLEGALPIISLPDFVAFHTAYANDRDAEYSFAQLVLALGQKGDTFLAISTSGRSNNILHAIQVANAKAMNIIGLTGETGGFMREHCTACIDVPERETFKIQELHLPVYHALCQALEHHFWK
jgi:D-sedoheptulose 7-phosphate isomerase